VILAVAAWLPAGTAQAEPPLCVLDGSAPAPTAAQQDPLAGRLGGTRESFEARFGSPIDEDPFFEYAAEGCAAVFANYYDGIMITVSVYFPGFADGQSEVGISQAMLIAERLLPLDVQMSAPYRNVTFVEHHECYSQSLAERVPFTAYEYMDNNPTAGQCSAVYSLDLTRIIHGVADRRPRGPRAVGLDGWRPAGAGPDPAIARRGRRS
jgi:hypothetical protein